MEQSNVSEKVDEVKKKYKAKVEKHKTKVKELTTLNEGLNGEILSLKCALEESKRQEDKGKGQIEDQLKVANIKWERKLQDVELNAEKAMVCFHLNCIFFIVLFIFISLYGKKSRSSCNKIEFFEYKDFLLMREFY